METEIEDTIKSRDKISPSNLQFGNVVFVKRENIRYP